MSFQSPDNEQQTQPSLCSRGCGFFASTSGMCSKCFRESQQAEQQHKAAEPKPRALQQASVVEVHSALPAEPAAEPSTAASGHEAAVTEPDAAPVSKTRCQVCRKKVGLTGFKCKCSPDAVFCGQHRYAEAHDCCFDYKAAAAKKIAAANPLVQAAKVDRI